jgi:hypothetical protein
MAGNPEVIRASSRFVSTNALPCTGLRARLPAPLVEPANLRRRFPFLVRLVHRYYGTVRQTITVPLLHCHAALKSRKMHYQAKILHSNCGIQGAFVLKSRTEWTGADAL